MAKRIQEFKYIPYHDFLETHQKEIKKFVDKKKAENALLKQYGFKFKRVTGPEINLIGDYGCQYTQYLDNDFVIVDGSDKLVNRLEALKAISEGRKAETGETLGAIYKRWLGIEGVSEKQIEYATRIKLNALFVLEELATVARYHDFYDKQNKWLPVVNALLDKVKNTKDAKQLIVFKDVLNSQTMKDKAKAVLNGFNFKGEKGKKFAEAIVAQVKR